MKTEVPFRADSVNFTTGYEGEKKFSDITLTFQVDMTMKKFPSHVATCSEEIR